MLTPKLSMINSQKHFGLDVLIRITYEHPDCGAQKLQEVIVQAINSI